MAEVPSLFRKRPSIVTMIGGALVLAGFLLTALDWRWLALCGVGAFGPGILRELGWVKDKDEFQQRAAQRAGYHAYLVGGLVAFALVGLIRAAGEDLKDAGQLVSVVLAVLWFTWLLSSLHAFWGPRKTVSRILLIFGWVWLVFNVIGHLQAGIVPLVMQSLLAVPFFLLAWVARRWPHVAGLFLLAVAAFFFWFFGLYEIFGPDPLAKGRVMVIVLFLGPLVASGIMLLGKDGPGAREEAATER